MKHLFTITAAIFLLAACQPQADQKKDREAIMAIMDNQVNCWNQGDLECFMKGYWDSDSVMYIGASGIKYGYQTALDNYKKNYPDEAARGQLKFDIVELQPIASDAYFMVGKFHLTRTIGDAKGIFTLVFRKINGEWVIIADHSSGTSE